MMTNNINHLLQKPMEVLEEIKDTKHLSNPYDIHSYVSKHYEQHFGSEMFNIIPSLNNMSTPNTVVRYRGIIQDMHNTEIVTANYLYKEPEEEQQDDKDDYLNDTTMVMVERELYYCIPIPGETNWSRTSFYPPATTASITTTTTSITTTRIIDDKKVFTKRKRNDSEDSIMSDDDDDELLEMDSTKKKRQHDEQQLNMLSTTHTSNISDNREEMLDFPIKGEIGLSCLVKLYGEDTSFKNTEIVDFVGILTFESSSTTCQEDDEDFCYFRPEATLVPRLHVLFFKKHKSVFDIHSPINTTSILLVRNQLLEYLTLEAVGGDALVAEVLLYHLISRVRAHNYGVTLGKFVLNIFGCDDERFAEKLNAVLYTILPSLHLFEMTNDNLENVRLAPVKDYQKDKLKSGLLQLPSGTHLILDENSMVEGNLFEGALKNISHLASLISTQKVDYDYSYHPLTMNVDIPVLIISKGKTLFHHHHNGDVNCLVKLLPNNSSTTTTTTTTTTIDQNQIQLFRSYICQLASNNNQDIALSQEVNQLVSQTFVRNRVLDPTISERDLHNWLTMAELVHLSFGKFNNQEQMETSTFEHAMNLVNRIKQRNTV